MKKLDKNQRKLIKLWREKIRPEKDPKQNWWFLIKKSVCGAFERAAVIDCARKQLLGTFCAVSGVLETEKIKKTY